MNKHVFTLDRFTQYVLLVIAVLLAVIAVELWQGRPSMLPAAQAQIPDSGRQRNQAITETRKTNRLLNEILEHLRTKPIKVKMETTDRQPGGRSKIGKP